MPIRFLHKILSKIGSKKNFIIPEGVIVDGFVYCGTPGIIAGTVNGDLFATSPIHILKTGTVNGDVKAWDVTISGTVNGNITGGRKISLQPDCYVLGNVSAPEVSTANNILVKGVILKSKEGDVPDVKSDFLQKENKMIKELEEKEALMEAEAAAMKHWEEQTMLETRMVKPVAKIENWF